MSHELKHQDDPASGDRAGENRGPFRPNRLKMAGAVAVVALVAGAIYWTGDSLSLERIAEKEASLRELLQTHTLMTYIAAFAIYIIVTGASLPGATPLTLAYAWFFGFWRAMVMVSFASTIGATFAFLASRYFLSDLVRARWGTSLQKFNDAFEAEGPYYLLSLRLIPQVPFFLINLVMGLTSIRVTTFYWVSQLGMLPGTAAYVYAGSRVPTLQTLAQEGVRSVFTWQLILALTLLGVLPITLRFLVKRLSGRPNQLTSD